METHILGGTAAQAILTLVTTLVTAGLIQIAQDAAKWTARRTYRQFLKCRARRAK